MENKKYTWLDSCRDGQPEKDKVEVDRLTIIQMYTIEEIERAFKELTRYDANSCSGGQDCWVELEPEIKGQLVKFDDIQSIINNLKK